MINLYSCTTPCRCPDPKRVFSLLCQWPRCRIAVDWWRRRTDWHLQELRRFNEMLYNMHIMCLPNMPKLDTDMVPPWNSCGCSLFSRALPASSFTFFEISSTPFRSAPKIMGVMSPFSVETATDTSTSSYSLMNVSIHAELASGTLRLATPTALMMKSLTETRAPCFSYFLFTWARNFNSCKWEKPNC